MHSVRNLSHHYGAQPTFSNISLDIKQGECVSLLGEWCGKSTLLRCIAGLVEPSGGTISVGGQEVYSANLNRAPGKRVLGLSFRIHSFQH